MAAQNHPGRDFFLHLLAFITLYWSMIALLTILFQVINKLLPDVLQYADPTSGPLRWGLSGVIVAYPVFVGVMMFFRNNKIHRPKFPIYFTLFVAGLTGIIDFATLVYTLTGGDITTRFILKVLAVLLVVGAVFGYELWNLKRKEGEMTPKAKSLITLSHILVIASVVLGFTFVGTPASQRAQQYDFDRVNDLRSLQYEIMNSYASTGVLPENLTGYRGSAIMDPATDMPYEYRVINETTFELCATFDKAGDGSDQYGGYAVGLNENFAHEMGKTCFERTVSMYSEMMPKRVF
ncbi:MAG: DUF5671 domain-containing protein [bacterium]|nr:DUF5671 domain-containing protein [bacterium]